MFAPGMPRTTPGTVRVRLTKFRPFSGSVWICSSLTVVPSSEDEVWTSGEAPVTVIDSWTAPISRRMLTRNFWSTPNATSGTVTVLKPESSAFTVYLPVGNEGTVYSPFESVTTIRVRPVPVFVSVTEAPGMTAPDESVMTPMMVPVTACAASERGSRLAAMIRPMTTLFTFDLHARASRRDAIDGCPRVHSSKIDGNRACDGDTTSAIPLPGQLRRHAVDRPGYIDRRHHL